MSFPGPAPPRPGVLGLVTVASFLLSVLNVFWLAVLGLSMSAVVSVGSATPPDELPGDRDTDKADARGDCFSNRGGWVAAWAPGAFQIGRLADDGRWYYWSGTSFAAPRFTAAILSASGFAGRTPLAFWRKEPSRDSAMYAAVGHPFIQFGLTPVLDSDSKPCQPA